MPIKPGYWYDIEKTPKYPWAVQIKLIPSERWLETQDPNNKYFEVLGRDNESREISLMNGSYPENECRRFITDNFKVKDDYQILTEEIYQLRQELVLDLNRLQKGIYKKDKEIAFHIQYALQMLDILEDYEDRGLGDIEY